MRAVLEREKAEVKLLAHIRDQKDQQIMLLIKEKVRIQHRQQKERKKGNAEDVRDPPTGRATPLQRMSKVAATSTKHTGNFERGDRNVENAAAGKRDGSNSGNGSSYIPQPGDSVSNPKKTPVLAAQAGSNKDDMPLVKIIQKLQQQYQQANEEKEGLKKVSHSSDELGYRAQNLAA